MKYKFPPKDNELIIKDNEPVTEKDNDLTGELEEISRSTVHLNDVCYINGMYFEQSIM